MSYINIPSTFALSKDEAIELFCERHSDVVNEDGTIDYDALDAMGVEGISFQSDYGSVIYLDFCDF